MIPAVASIAELKVHQKWSRGHAGRPAGRAIAANRGGLTVEEKQAQATRLPEIKKKWDSESYPESYPNHTRIMLQTSQVWTMVHLKSQDLCSVSLFSFATTRHRLCLLLLLRIIRQQNPAAKVAACNSTSMPTPKRTHHSDRTRAARNSRPASKRSTCGIVA